MAMLHGWGDPLRFLDLEGVEAAVAMEVVRVAQDLYHQRSVDEIKAIGVAVGNAVGRVLAKAFGS